LRILFLSLLCLVAGCNPVDDLRVRLAMKEGNLAYLRSDFEGAIARYDQARALDPGRARVHLNAGYSLMALARSTADSVQRVEYASRAIRSFSRLEDPGVSPRPGQDGIPDPDRIEHFVLTLLLDTGQRDEAMRQLGARIERDPADFASMQLMSNLCVEAGSVDEAMSWRERLVDAQPDLPEAHYSLSIFAWRLSHYDEVTDPGQRKAVIERGLQAAARALELRPHYFEALTSQGLLWERSGLEELATAAEALAQELWKTSIAVADSMGGEVHR
jgi:tetratricopeptide (TPR) repeat protein